MCALFNGAQQKLGAQGENSSYFCHRLFTNRCTRSTEGGPQWDTPPWVTVPTTVRTHARGAKASFCSLKSGFYVKVCEPGQIIYPPCLRCPDFSSRILGTGKLL